MQHDTVMSFEEIHDEFRPRIHRFLCRMVGEADAEDVLQEVFVKANRALSGFRGESSLTTWIYRIATNAALDHVRSSSFRQGAMTVDIGAVESQPEAQGGELMEATPLPDLLLIRDDMDACIREVVCSLPEPFLTALVLSNLNELTNAETAGVLGISLEAVKIRIHRARAKLRKELEKKCDFYRDARSGLACDRKPVSRKTCL